MTWSKAYFSRSYFIVINLVGMCLLINESLFVVRALETDK